MAALGKAVRSAGSSGRHEITKLKIDTLCLEGIYPQKVMRFFQLIFRPKNIPQVEQNIVSFGLNSSSMRVKDGQMSMIEGHFHSPKKYKSG
jgi:hypothetical protein